MTNPTTPIRQLGEFGLIDRIHSLLGSPTSPELIIGIGDDCAVFEAGNDRVWLATCDMQMQNVHFKTDYASWFEIGRKAMAVNISDIAAMGGTPQFAFSSLGLPDNIPTGDFDDLIRGLRDMASECGTIIAGGNLCRSEANVVIDLFVVGTASKSHILTRSGAKAGDRIFVTGVVGAAATGLRLLDNFPRTEIPTECARLVERFLLPTPRVSVGQMLASSRWATSAIDISDGLASDLMHLLESSRCGATLQESAIPITPEMEKAIRRMALTNTSASSLVLHGGEDYELLFTVEPATPDSFLSELTQSTNVTITEIGIMTEAVDQLTLQTLDGKSISVSPNGWTHFSPDT